MFEEENIDTPKDEVEYRTIDYGGHKFKVKIDGTIYLMPVTRDRYNPNHNYWTKGEKGKDGRMYFMSMPVDQIVLSAYQDKPIYSSEIEHIDKDLTNNRIENLRLKEYIQDYGNSGRFNDNENVTEKEEEIQSDSDLESQFAYLIRWNKEKEEALKEEERRRKEEREREMNEMLRQVEIQKRWEQKYAVTEEETPQRYRNPLYPKPSIDSYVPYKPQYYSYESFQHPKSSIHEDVRKLKRKGKEGQLLTYALDENNELVYVNEVKNGNDCGCRCPHCKEPLCAENGGKKKVHYFSHRNGSDCVGACEAALHLLAKKVLQEGKVLSTPVFVDGKVERLDFDRVDVEVFDAQTGRKPDCVAYKNGEKPLWVEFKNTHAVDEEKIKIIRDNAIECIEVDLGGCELDEEKLRRFLTTTTENRIWIYSERNEEIIKEENKRRLDAYKKQVEDYKDRVMFAYNDLNEMIHVDDAKGKKCHCILCERPMEILFENNSYYFHHLDEKCQIDETAYCKVVIKSLIEKCVKAGRLDIILSAKVGCKNLESCPMPMADCQIKKRSVTFDLVQIGFKHGGQGYIEEISLISDIQLIKEYPTGEKIKIDIVFKSNVDYSNVNGKLIEIDANYQTINDLLNYQSIGFSSNTTYYNFGVKAVERGKIGRKIKRFHLYNNGNCYLEDDNLICSTLPKGGKPSEVLGMNIFGTLERGKCYRLATMYCITKGLNVFPCNACRFMKETYGGDMICVLYKKKGTPQYPLLEKKSNCIQFKRDDNLMNEMSEFEKMIEIQEYKV